MQRIIPQSQTPQFSFFPITLKSRERDMSQGIFASVATSSNAHLSIIAFKVRTLVDSYLNTFLRCYTCKNIYH